MEPLAAPQELQAAVERLHAMRRRCVTMQHLSGMADLRVTASGGLETMPAKLRFSHDRLQSNHSDLMPLEWAALDGLWARLGT
jgi:hypothetical protein